MAEYKTAVQEAAERAGVVGLVVRRWLGCWIDLILLAALIAGVLLGGAAIPQVSEAPSIYVLLAIAVPVLRYFPITEGFWGRSLGKLITGLKVVDRKGRTPGIGRATVRTLFRLIEVNPFLLGGIPAGLVVAFTKRKQRIGDLIADTYVLDATEIRNMDDVDATLAAMRAAPPA